MRVTRFDGAAVRSSARSVRRSPCSARSGPTGSRTPPRSDGVALGTIEAIYHGRFDPQPTIVACARSGRVEAQLVTTLANRYPDDASAIITLLLNRVTLQPGEAIHLTAGNLHAYLGGAGIELMGASDNVVRGGLTVKHVDVDELLRILDPTPLVQPLMPNASRKRAGTRCPRRAAPSSVEPGSTHTSTGHELTVGLDGRTFYLPPGATLSPSVTSWVVVVG